MFGLGVPELLIILVILVLLFGAGRIAGIGGALGRSIKEFRKEANNPELEGKDAEKGGKAAATEGSKDDDTAKDAS